MLLSLFGFFSLKPSLLSSSLSSATTVLFNYCICSNRIESNRIESNRIESNTTNQSINHQAAATTTPLSMASPFSIIHRRSSLHNYSKQSSRFIRFMIPKPGTVFTCNRVCGRLTDAIAPIPVLTMGTYSTETLAWLSICLQSK